MSGTHQALLMAGGSAAGETDPFFSDVVLLVLGDNSPNTGTTGSNTHIDRSPLALTIDTTSAGSGGPWNSTDNPLMGSAGSIKWDGQGLTVSSGQASAWDFGSGPLTWEYVGVGASGGSDRHIFDCWSQRFLFRHSGGNIQVYTSFASPLFDVAQAWPTSGTHHWALGRDGSNQWTLWYDGVVIGTTTNSGTFSSTAAQLRISTSSAGSTIPGHGVARMTKASRYTYNTNYTLPTSFPTA